MLGLIGYSKSVAPILALCYAHEQADASRWLRYAGFRTWCDENLGFVIGPTENPLLKENMLEQLTLVFWYLITAEPG